VLRAVILGPDQELAEELYTVSTRCGDFAVYSSHYELPPFDRLVRIVNHNDPNVMLVEIEQSLESLVTMRDILETNPNLAIVGYSADPVDETSPVRELCEVITRPFQPQQIQDAVVRAIEAKTASLRNNIFAFLPAKGGNGATLTAMNCAAALAHYWKRKVLVVEADLHSGYMGIALKADATQTVVEALRESEALSERSWKRLVYQTNGVDWLLTARGKQTPQIAPWEYQRLLTFAAALYDAIVVDLPEVVNDATEMVVRRASQVFVVSTPEAPSLFLARRRLHDLKSRRVADGQRKVLLNRFTKGDRTVSQYEEILGHPVSVVVSNDYQEVQRAAWDSGFVSRDSRLGRDYFLLAKEIAQEEPVEPPPEAIEEKGGLGRGMRRLFGKGS
jgi:Flp pilus assembly CpaE family ATPase